MKRMLINATQPEEIRIALVDGQTLYDLDVETPHHQKKKANIYKGKITRIEPSLEAAFVDYGSERHGFLPFKEVAEEYYPNSKPESGRFTIKDVLSEGQEVIVQVQKEERGNKGAALTTQITLAGPYVVMMPNNPKAGGISRRIEGDDRSDIRDTLKDLETPDGMGLIVRTAGVGKSTEELQWGVNYLIQLWDAIQKAANDKQAPFLIHQESDIVILAIRDYLRQDIGEIIIDDMDTFHKARDFIQHVMPQQVYKVKPYQDTVPLFTRFQIESQIESAYQREVTLPSGGAIVIDITEALTAIDINSSRATKGGDIEETAFNTNMEAACEIARQLRLRDLGGLVVIDFIDMHSSKHQREVENKMREAVKSDRARVQIGKISRFGLLEMSRQRLRPSIEESTQIVCPRCHGVGVIRGVESLGLSILRLLEEESMKENTRRVTVQIPVDVATFLLNEKRNQITKIEDRHNLHILIVPNEHLETPQYIMERTRHGDEFGKSASYEIKEVITAEQPQLEEPQMARAKEEPAVQNIQPSAPPPAPKQESKPGLFARVWKALFSRDVEQEEEQKAQSDKNHRPQNKRRRTTNNQRDEQSGRNRNRRRNTQDERGRNGRKRNAQEKNEAVETVDIEETTLSQEESESPKKSNRRNNRNRRNRDRDNVAHQTSQTDKEMLDETAELETGETDTDSAKTDNGEEDGNKSRRGGQRRRSRYNSRSYNSRRRAPAGAETMSISSPAPGSETEKSADQSENVESTPDSETPVTEVIAVETEVNEVETPEVAVASPQAAETEEVEQASEEATLQSEDSEEAPKAKSRNSRRRPRRSRKDREARAAEKLAEAAEQSETEETADVSENDVVLTADTTESSNEKNPAPAGENIVSEATPQHVDQQPEEAVAKVETLQSEEAKTVEIESFGTAPVTEDKAVETDEGTQGSLFAEQVENRESNQETAQTDVQPTEVAAETGAQPKQTPEDVQLTLVENENVSEEKEKAAAEK
ncbi:Rne/Rng family ribonuclease [Thiomicrorhabdus heinhorstiae]|uniref:Ribonuclease E n=1 Tax=Thiomicrorhabdus heinhorstiae TaxID=2748010 RepID=A0ABS0C2K5_9GAMM|nr:Rne/Rng family ribonuclease [Thiomicrorhabdus heinhorstiae]MBF6058517.1 Rne/Rng family ribonuclease [Thiomicrorhabdus heinhorstiae]